MILKLLLLVNPAVQHSLEVLSSEPFVPKASIWPLAKTIRKAKSESEVWDNARISIIKKYGDVDEKGNVKVRVADIDKANAELSECLTNEIEIPLTAPIRVPATLPEASKLTAQDLATLLGAGLIEEEAPKPKA